MNNNTNTRRTSITKARLATACIFFDSDQVDSIRITEMFIRFQ